MTFGKGWIFSGLVYLSLTVVSCGPGTKEAGNPADGAVVGDGMVDTSGFLQTDFDPINKWFDERFDVEYKHMTPELIFDQVPLNGIYYQTNNLPEKGEPFNFSSDDVSRRELLKKVSEHWKLKMSLSTDDAGNPNAVVVNG